MSWWLWTLYADKSCGVLVLTGEPVCLTEAFAFEGLFKNKQCVTRITPWARLSHQVCLSDEEDTGMEIPVPPRFPLADPTVFSRASPGGPSAHRCLLTPLPPQQCPRSPGHPHLTSLPLF